MYLQEIINDKYSESLLLKLEKSKFHDYDKIIKAMEFSKKCHQGQVRDFGEPYYSHPFEVAELLLLSSYPYLTGDGIITALLHDVVEDSDATYEIIEELFGRNVSFMVGLLTKYDSNGQIVQFPNIINNLFVKSKEAALIKICDRLHNISTMSLREAEKQNKLRIETATYIMPLAETLEIGDYIKRIYEILYNKKNSDEASDDSFHSDFSSLKSLS
jgi:(p)ppGpp synthase/HD superfamily hydrolase